MLSCMNYTEWSAVMRVNLQAAGLWEAVLYDGINFQDDILHAGGTAAGSAGEHASRTRQ
jgi:hypothetical protein